MDEGRLNKDENNHSLQLSNRENLHITGVSKVFTFNESLVVLNTKMGMLNIKGKNMKVNKLNVDSGDMSIEGEILSLIYGSKSGEGHKKGSFVEKLFK